jgi:hypothetical protein
MAATPEPIIVPLDFGHARPLCLLRISDCRLSIGNLPGYFLRSQSEIGNQKSAIASGPPPPIIGPLTFRLNGAR